MDNGEVKVKVAGCPTEVVWADILTKLIHGTTFRVMWAQLIDCVEDCF